MASTPPVGPGSRSGSEGSQEQLPPIPKGFRASPAWVAFFMKMFPTCSAADAQMYAAAFQNNMMQMLSHQIQQQTAKAHEASQYMKDVIEGNE